MGYYTEFHFNVELSLFTPPDVLTTLEYMLDADENKRREEYFALDHPFFATDRWWSMLVSDSYLFHTQTHSVLVDDLVAFAKFLSIRCNFKNYCNEVALFLDWIRPHLDNQEKGDFLGFYREESSQKPTLIYYGLDFDKRLTPIHNFTKSHL